jgi:hypothetical protein
MLRQIEMVEILIFLFQDLLEYTHLCLTVSAGGAGITTEGCRRSVPASFKRYFINLFRLSILYPPPEDNSGGWNVNIGAESQVFHSSLCVSVTAKLLIIWQIDKYLKTNLLNTYAVESLCLAESLAARGL